LPGQKRERGRQVLDAIAAAAQVEHRRAAAFGQGQGETAGEVHPVGADSEIVAFDRPVVRPGPPAQFRLRPGETYRPVQPGRGEIAGAGDREIGIAGAGFVPQAAVNSRQRQAPLRPLKRQPGKPGADFRRKRSSGLPAQAQIADVAGNRQQRRRHSRLTRNSEQWRNRVFKTHKAGLQLQCGEFSAGAQRPACADLGIPPVLAVSRRLKPRGGQLRDVSLPMPFELTRKAVKNVVARAARDPQVRKVEFAEKLFDFGAVEVHENVEIAGADQRQAGRFGKQFPYFREIHGPALQVQPPAPGGQKGAGPLRQLDVRPNAQPFAVLVRRDQASVQHDAAIRRGHRQPLKPYVFAHVPRRFLEIDPDVAQLQLGRNKSQQTRRAARIVGGVAPLHGEGVRAQPPERQPGADDRHAVQVEARSWQERQEIDAHQDFVGQQQRSAAALGHNPHAAKTKFGSGKAPGRFDPGELHRIAQRVAGPLGDLLLKPRREGHEHAQHAQQQGHHEQRHAYGADQPAQGLLQRDGHMPPDRQVPAAALSNSHKSSSL